MKHLNKNIFSIFLSLISFLTFSNSMAATDAGYDLNQVMKISLIVTLIFIAILMWFAIVYSEKNDFKGELFKVPFKKLMSYLTRTVPIEKEEDIMFHHNFDGIKELDNRIPPWFSLLFYGTIVFSIIYMIVFHVVGDGNVQLNEYNLEIQQASFEREMLIRSGAFISEETVTLADDAATISEGKEIYQKNCTACHANDGGGGVGPNLTDDYWIHGGGIKNIFKTIKYGVPSKGMISWQSQLDPSKMRAVASYIISLHGTKPLSPKQPEGTIWKEEEIKTN